MSPHDDADLRDRLAELPVPDHAPGFWDALGDELRGDGPIRLEPAPESPAGLRAPWADRRWLAAAAAVLLVVAGVGAFLTRDDEPASVGVTSDPTVPDGGPDDPGPDGTTPDLTSLPGPLRPAGDAQRLEPGRVVAVSPDGRFLYVAADHPDGGQGCEGAAREALFVEPVAGGERVLATRADIEPIEATAGLDLRFGPDGAVAALSYCESSVSSLRTSTLAADGTFGAVADLDLGVDSILDLEFLPGGDLVASTFVAGAPGDAATRQVLRFPPGPSESDVLPLDGTILLAVTADGRLATRDEVGTIRLDGSDVGTEDEVFDLAVSGDGRVVVTAGAGGVTVRDLVDGTTQRVLDDAATSSTSLVDLQDDGDLVVRAYDASGVQHVYSIRIEPGQELRVSELFSDAEYGRLHSVVLSPDDTTLWVTTSPDAGETDEPSVVLDAIPLTR